MAIRLSRQGSHRLVSKEEELEILKRAEDNGLVHEVNPVSYTHLTLPTIA